MNRFFFVLKEKFLSLNKKHARKSLRISRFRHRSLHHYSRSKYRQRDWISFGGVTGQSC